MKSGFFDTNQQEKRSDTTDHFSEHLLLSNKLEAVGNTFYFADDESKRTPLLQDIKIFRFKTARLKVEYNNRTPLLPQTFKEFSDRDFTDHLIRICESLHKALVNREVEPRIRPSM